MKRTIQFSFGMDLLVSLVRNLGQAILRFTAPRKPLSPALQRVSVSSRLANAFARLAVVAGLVVLGALGNRVEAQVDVTATGGTLMASYTTLKGAFDAINAGTHTGTITIGISANTTETASAVLNASGNMMASYTTIGISPTGGAARSITGAIAGGTPMIDFNGADNVTVNGLNTGGNSLTISNTTVSATSGTSTIRFQADATNNVITNCSVLGSASMAVGTNGGNIWFGSAAITTGNDNNTVSNCLIGPAGANLPSKGICFSGSSNTDPGTSNSGIIINNNEIYDYFSATVSNAGIDLNSGTTNITISNNKFYQTSSRTITTGLTHSGIRISNINGNNYQITGNTIGFASGTGTGAYTLVFPASSSVGFVPINLSVGTTTATSVQGNTVASIVMSGSANGTSSSAVFRGIFVASGLTTIGNVTGNTVGSMSATGNITYTSSSTSASDVVGIFNFGSSNWTTNNNSIGGITVSNSSTGASNLYGIRVNTSSSVTFTCQNNTIGGTIANSLQSTSTATGTIVNGILVTSPASTITGNMVQNMTVAGGTLTGTSAAMIGIAIAASSANHTVQQNIIHSLGNSNSGTVTVVTGINYSSSTGTNLITKNLVHSLNNASATGIINGINVTGGTATYQNNMIRLGIDAAGTGINTGCAINGINETVAGTDNFYFNSVYIGGSGVGGASNTFAFQSTITTNTRAYQNNIFINARSNGGGTGKHYAIRVGGTAPNPGGLTSNYNDLNVTGTGGFIGLFNAVDQLTLANWRTATGQDANSFSFDPQYINPTGTSATVDLHISASNPTPIESAGTNIASVTDDYDSQTRASFTPVDMGADAGNFVVLDIVAPTISYTSLTGSCGTGDVTLSPVTISDATGVPISGILRPRIYYKKNAGAYFSQPGALSTGTGINGTWNFTIVVADLGGVVAGDVISYYVIAQDLVATPNISSNPAGVVAVDVNTITTPPTPNTFSVLASISGTFTVGVGGNYTTLKAAVDDYNTKCVSGPVVFSLTDATYSETTPITINQVTGSSATNTLTIKPAVGIAPSISGSSSSAIIILNGADFVTIDGSNGSTSNTVCPPSAATRDLTITNTNAGTTSAVVWLQSTGSNGATDNKVINCNLVGNSNITTLVGLGAGSSTISITSLGTGNNNNAYINNNISKVQYGIYTQGASAANKNTGTTINQNLLNNASPDNIKRAGIMAGFENNVTISGNNISNMASAITVEDVFGISLGATTAISTSTFTGNEVTNAVVSNNIIGSVRHTNTYSACGIFVAPATSGTNRLANNMISGVSANGTSGDFSVGILLGGGAGSTTQLYYNTVSMSGTQTLGSDKSYAVAIGGSNPIVDMRNNILVNTQNNGTGNNYAIGYGYSTFTGLTSDNNDFHVTAGATYFVGGTGSISSPTNQLTFANLKAATGKDANSKNVLPEFVSSSDLHLLAGGSNNLASLSGMGAVIGAVTTDIDCQNRNNNPDIGAHELCTLTTSIAISENSGTANDGTICEGTSVTLTASNGGTYHWEGGESTAAITVSPTTTTTYAVTVTDAGGCTATASQTITVLPAATANAGADQMTCVNGIVQIFGVVGGSATGGMWSDGGAGGTFTPNATTLNAFYTPPSGNTNPITLTLTTTGGSCPATDALVVTYGTLPPLTLTAIAPAIGTCGDNVVFTIEATNGFVDISSLQYSVNWDQTKLMYVSHTSTVIGGIAGGVGTFNVANGQLTYAWVDPSGSTGEDLANNTVLLTITMKILASTGTANVNITGVPTPIEGTNAQFCFLTVNTNNTSLTVTPITVTCPGNQSVCVNAAPFTLTGGAPAGGTYSGPGVSAGSFNPATAGVGVHTITYTYTNANSCTNSCTFTITVNALPVVTCPSDQSVTVDAVPFALTGESPTGGTYSGPGVSAGIFNPASAGVGMHTITYSYTDGNTCTNTCTFVITVTSALMVTCPADQSVCIDVTPYTLTGGTPAGGDYTGDGVTANVFDPAAAGTGPHTITYTYTDGSSTDDCTFIITVNALPVVTCPVDQTVCINTAPYTLTGGSPAGGTYSGDGVSANVFDPSAAGTGPHTITYSYTDGNTCTNTCTFTITVNALPVVTCPSDFAVCVNAAPVTLSGGAPSGGTYSGPGVSGGIFTPATAGVGMHTITYTYSDGTCSNSCTFVITVNALPVVTCPANQSVCLSTPPYALTGASPAGGAYSGPGVSGGIFDPVAAGLGTHTITYTYTDGNSCTNTCTFTIQVNSSLVITCPANQTVCITTAPYLLTGGTPAGGTFSGPGVSANIFNPATAGLGTHTITYTYSDGTCSNTCTFTITVNALPVVTCPANSSVCLNAAPFTLTGGSPAGGTYSGPGVTANVFSPAVAGVGVHTITYTYSDGTCSNTCTFTITVNALPVVTCPANSSVCINAAPFALTGGAPAGGTYTGPGVSAGIFSPAVAGLGTHTITYTYSDGTCTNTCTFTITVNALPVVTCPANQSVCLSTPPYALTGGSPAGGTYSGPGVSGGIFDPTVAGVGTHTITYSYTDGNSCTNTCTFSIMVNTVLAITCPANQSVCISAAPFVLTGGSPTGGTYSGPGVSGGIFTPSVAGVGVHTITYSYNDGTCSNSCTFTITVNALPVVTCPVNQSVCLNTPPYALTGASPVGGTYSGPGVSGGIFNPATAGIGIHTITYTYTDGNTCTNTCTFTITVSSSSATANAGPDQLTCVNGIVHLAGSIGGGAVSATWSDGGIGGTFSPDANTLDAFYVPPFGNTLPITLTLTTSDACPGIDNMVVTYGTLPPLELTATGPASATCGDLVTFTVDATTGFVDISSLQYSINWDQTELMYVSHTATVIGTGAPGVGTFNVVNGQLTYAWFDPAGSDGEDLANGSVLLTITMKVLVSTGIANVNITGVPTPIEATNSQFCTLTVNTFNNAVTTLLPIAVTCPGNSTVCFDAAPFALTGGLPAGGTYSGTGVSAGVFNPAMANVGANTITYSYTAPSGCSNSCTFVITVNAALNLSVNTTNVLCNGGATGAIDLTVSGGNGTYTYDWSNDGAETPDNDTEDLSLLTAGTYTVTVTDGVGCTKTISATLTEPTAIVLGTTQVNVLCNGAATGSIDLTVSGGAGSYTYDWSNDGAETPDNDLQDLSGLTAGTYTVTVTDLNGCTKTTVVTITEPSAIVLTTSQVDVLCNGGATGSIDLTVSGGVGPYTYDWSNDGAETPDNDLQDLSGLTAGIYTVTVTDLNGCTKTTEVTITEPAALVLGTTQVDVLCNGGATGSIDLTVSGGVGPYTYDWSNDGAETPDNDTQDLSGLTAGAYTVTVTDFNGCTKTTDVTITEPTAIVLTTTQVNVLCNGAATGSIDLTVNGGVSPYTYDWSNDGPETPDNDTQDLSGIAAGPYMVTVTDFNGCTKTTAVTITQPTAINISVSVTGVQCNGAATGAINITVSGGAGGYTYDWSNDGPDNPDDDTEDLTGLTAGSYTVTITDANACTATAVATVNQPSAIVLSTTQVDINCNGGSTGSIDLTVSGGIPGYTYSWTGGATTQDISGLAAGTYTVTVTDVNSCTKTTSVTISQSSAIVLTETHVNVLCNGDATGSIDLTVSGGTPGYTYLWTGGATTQDISNLIAGTYTVTVTDASGCTTSTSAIITQPPAILLTTTQVNVLCNGAATGSIDLSVLGGTGSYTYDWSNDGPETPDNDTQDLSGLTAGTYTVTVTDANGCSKTTVVTITQSTAIVLTETHVNVLCNGAATGSIDLTVSGGTPGYTYSWTGGATTQDPSGLLAGTYTVTVTDASNCTKTLSVTITEPTTIVLTETHVNVLCNGAATGSIDLTVSGGVGPYTYDWSNDGPETPDNDTQDLSGLTAGTYTVTVTDFNGCTKTTAVTLTQPTAIVLTTTQTNVLCNGAATGAIDLTVSGGTPGYTYLWTGGATTQDITNLLAGTYTVTVTDLNGCTKTTSATITQSTALVLTTTQVNVLCNGAATGSIDLTVSGGTPGYTYNWTGGATTQDVGGLIAGTYTVTVTDLNGCSKTTSATITQPTAIVLTETHVNVLCNGAATGSIDLTVNGGTPGYTYNWTTGATTQDVSGLVANTYTVTVTDLNGCTKTTSVTITQPTLLVLSTTQVNVLCNGALTGSIDLTVSGGMPGYTYSWTGGATSQDVTGLAAGTYTVTVTDLNGCTKTTSATITQPATSMTLSTTVTPACTGGANGAIDLTVSGGTPGYTYNWTGGATMQDVSGLTAGTYTVTVTDLNGCTKTTTAIVNQSTALNLTTIVTNTCIGFNNGAIDLSVSGGTPAYTYDWSNNGPQNPDTDPQDLTNLAAGTYTVTVTDAIGCFATVSATVVGNPSPTAFTVTGGGAVCTTDVVGIPVGLSGSQLNVNYQLFRNAVAVGLPVPGTGFAITFGQHIAVGTYTVVATAVPAGCTANMTGSVTITTFNCGVTITDPCVCLDNATTLFDGQFGETIKINAPGTQNWFVTAINGLYASNSPAPPAAPIAIPLGTALTNLGAAMNMFQLIGRHVDAIGYTITVSNGMGTSLTIGNSCQYPNPTITSDLNGDFCLFSDPITLTGTPGDANIISAGFTVNGVPATQFNPNQGIGTYVIEYTVNGGVPKAFGPNDPGCIQRVSQIVHVVTTPAVLNCNDQIYVSLPASCVGEIRPDDVLEGTYGCFDDYQVELDRTLPLGNGPWTSPLLNAGDIGHTYQTRITHLVSGNKCWGLVTIEDKLAPEMVCEDIHLICPITTYDPAYLTNVLNIPAGTPTITDCSNFTSGYVDTWFDVTCTGSVNGFNNVSAYVQRKWTATDQWGNSTTCLQYLYFDRLHVVDVHFPADYTISCSSNLDADPSVTGAPYFEAFGLQWPLNPGAGFCEIQSAYVDQILPVCDGTYKILRTWTVLDWCLPTSQIPPFYNPMYYIQLIKVVDDQGPVMTCPANMTVSTDPFNCCATVDLPDRIIEDACSRVNNISGMVVTFDPYTGAQTGMVTFGGNVIDFPGNNWWDRDTMGQWGYTPCLPIGSQIVTYIAEDDCGNSTTCTFRLTVADYIPPVSSCDQTTVVGIGYDDPHDCYTPDNGCDGAGVTWVKASTYDDGSYDECSQIKLTVRRMAPYSDCINNLSKVPCFPNGQSEYDIATAESDSIKFYCCEVGQTETVILRVYQVDVNGNVMNGPDGEPLFNECMVQVEVQDKLKPICQAPANVTVTCEQFDPSLWLYGKASLLDNCCLDSSRVYQGQCGLTHAVNYSQFDTLCNKGTITRTFRAFDCHGNSSQCTQRVVVTYEQDYYVKFPNDVIVTVCDGTGVYGEPTFFGEDCELLGVSYEDQIFTVVPDACFKIERNWKIINWCTYNPNLPCINVPNPTPNAITNHPTNLPGPIVSPIQTVGDPWKSTIVKINPGDALATNYSVYYDPNANCYTYKQIIKIIDTQDPIVECPASPVTICDLTANDPQLWNASYWWDNHNQSHDLCEAPSEICLTATDACSGSNISFEYQLFLDLDGDGTMETVVNSTQLGNQVGGLGWNNILYGNATGAGTPRQFDGRPVPTNQKWGFAIQETVSGTNKTACVKFNTFQAQNTFVTPQLPHGTHKIKWFVTDGCGNETICEYTIIVKDCKAPTVVCFNGLSVNIMPTGMIQMWATDFLQYSDDNCTLTPWLKYGIRKCGTGTGFPVDGNGNPITNVAFTCDEVGTQCVELWAIDLAGNADYCETFVIIQDNNGNCTNSDLLSVAGNLRTEMEDGIEEGSVEISGSVSFAPPFFQFDLSDIDGHYEKLNAIPVTADYLIKPVKDDNPLNGITTYDLVLISQHILGIAPLGSPYKMIAADANKSGSITTFDIVEIRKLILGIYQEFPDNTSWRFVDKAFSFTDPANPFQDNFPETISIANALADQMEEHFVGVKIGDVNNTVVVGLNASADDRTTGTLLLDVNDRTVQAGEVFEVTFKAAEKNQGFQMTLNLDGLSVAEIVGSDRVTANNFGVHNKALTVSIDGADAFTVKFRATKAGKLSDMLHVSSEITKAEAYGVSNADGGVRNERLEVALRFNSANGSTVQGVGFELYQNQPNPFVNKTAVGFHLPEATSATLTVYDEMGRVVFTQKGDFAKGYNTISLDRALLNTTGVLYYTLETATDSATKKMVQTK